MSMIELLKLVFVLITGAFGLLAILQPVRVAQAALLSADTPHAAAEIRASWGGLFTGLALAALLLRSQDAYTVLGLAYLLVAAVRAGTWLLNRNLMNRAVWGFLLFEVVSAVVFLLPGNLI